MVPSLSFLNNLVQKPLGGFGQDCVSSGRGKSHSGPDWCAEASAGWLGDSGDPAQDQPYNKYIEDDRNQVSCY